MQLRKGLGFIEIWSIATGAMISSGLFVLPGIAHARAGPAVVVSYFLAGLLAMTGMLSIAELVTAMPRAGGDYFFISRGMGPAVGTIAGFLSWFALSLKSAFALVGMAAFMYLVVPVDIRIIGVALTVLFIAINLLGVKEAGRLQVALVAGLLGLMLVYIAWGLPSVEASRLRPFAPFGMGAVAATTGFVFVAYGGLLNIASVSEEVRAPGRVIPLALILSLAVVMLFYTLMVLVTTGVLADEVLDGSLTPISDGARAFLGRGGFIALSIGAILAFISTANAGILSASRYLLALSRDGLAPAFLSRVGARRKTPDQAIIVTGGFIILALFASLDFLVGAASTVVILTYILANLSVVVLRESRVQNYKPRFRSPLYPWVQLAGVVGLAFVAVQMGLTAFFVSMVLAGIGFLTYWFYGRRQADTEYALLHLIERITARELVTGTLEAELKGIIRERDEVTEDRFDGTVENSVVLDVEGPLPVGEFFNMIARRIAEKTHLDASMVERLLQERERESSTVLMPGLAIPHIIVPGNGFFDIALARSRRGIHFSKDAPAVHAVFVLIGTRDERNFHLRALSAIAQIVHEPTFQDKWQAARGEQALRDVVLLAQRMRPEQGPPGEGPLR